MAATRASGTNAVRYGTMKDNVLSLGVVTADGAFLRTASRAKKSSAGYDLTRLFVGSEGTLGVIVEVTLRLAGIPEAIAGGHCPFPTCAPPATRRSRRSSPASRSRASSCSTRCRSRRATPIRSSTLPETPMLFVEFHGTRGERRRTVAPLRRDRRRTRRRPVRLGDQAGGAEPSSGRRATTPIGRRLALRPGARPFATDVCVPISRLADCVEETQRDIAEHGLIAPIVGHVGDGNFHVSPLIDMNDADEIERAERFGDRLARRAIAMDGTCTGEHGVGQKKIAYPRSRARRRKRSTLMRRVKIAFDPQNMFNPGKIFRE